MPAIEGCVCKIHVQKGGVPWWPRGRGPRTVTAVPCAPSLAWEPQAVGMAPPQKKSATEGELLHVAYRRGSGHAAPKFDALAY